MSGSQKRSVFALSLILWAGTLPLAAQPSSPAGDRAPRELATVPLATFQLANGNEIRFIGVPEEDEILIAEIVPAGPNENFVLEAGAHPVDIFKRLAPADAAVPAMIARLDTKKKLAGRKSVASLEGPIAVPLERLGLSPAGAPRAGGGSCQEGAAGAAYFEKEHCNTLGGPGYGKSEKYCLAAQKNSIDQDTSSRRRATYSRMASCGTGFNQFRHFYGVVSGWTTQVVVIVDSQKVVDLASWKKGVKRHRRVRFEEGSSGGWVRGWVAFHSQVAGGW